MRVVRMLVTIISLISIVYRYKAKIINVMASIPFLRRNSIRIAMQVPFLRNKFMQSIFPKK
ncbi:hypothetical protein [Gracilibacillus xinjiangensis]|uniref:Uncharacterized protein n=1 Tax=Gracilibacillus xinjiangensis TaxID=1193282 RepID=A0ABV8WX98_9BACI